MSDDAPNNIRILRKARGLTQEQLASALGVHLVTISNLERGKLKLSRDWAARIAETLRVVEAALYKEADAGATKIYVAGEYAAGTGFTSYGIDTATELTVNFHRPEGLLAEWYRVADDALHPVFKRGDLIQCARPGPEAQLLVGDMHFVTDDSEAMFLVIPTVWHGKNVFDLYRFNGPPLLKYHVRGAVRVTAAIFGRR